VKPESYYYNCSPAYIKSISPDLHSQVIETIEVLPKRETQSDINFDLFWLLTSVGWSYDTVPAGMPKIPPECFSLDCTLEDLKPKNLRMPCLTSETLQTKWHADFAKQFDTGLVQIEAQFGKVEALFKDFCGFRIVYAERRLALGIELVLVDPASYFSHRKKSFGEMASFKVAMDMLNTIGLDCPIWLVGIKD
jgi:hypothetical protein